MPRRLVFILCALILAACQAGIASQPTGIPASTDTSAPPTAIATSTPTTTLVATGTPTLEPTSTPGPRLTVLPMIKPLSPDVLRLFPVETVIPTPDSFPTLIPTMLPENIAGQLQTAFKFRDLDDVDGYSLHQITGWKYGYSFSWIDVTHLLLYLKVGEYDNGGINGEYQPVIANLATKKIWIPPVNKMVAHWAGHSSNILHWSAELGMSIVPNEDKNTIDIYTLNGKKLKTYKGTLTDVSPSGTKILVNRNTWIDLGSGKVVEFAWEEYCGESEDNSHFTIWSADETQVYISLWLCYIHYGNAKTGQSYETAGFNSLYHGTWVLNDTYMLAQWNSVDDGSPGYIPLFDPLEKTYHNLNELVGIPSLKGLVAPSCFASYIAPGGKYIWTFCYDTDEVNYLIDLAALKADVYPNSDEKPLGYRGWSLDGNFLILRQGYDNKPTYSILSVASKGLRPLPIEPVSDPMFWWNPTKSIVAYLSKENKSLVLLDAETMFAKEVMLPAGFCNYYCMAWHPSGDQLALKAGDGSIWQIDYPKLETLEQLTPPIAGDFSWSPDGTSLAFSAGTDIYIVDTQVKP